jgi:hypothetical protein
MAASDRSVSLAWARRAPLAVALLALLLRVWAPGPVTQTFDERSWMARSAQFRQALLDIEPSRATAAADGQLATMPGVTTMWSGTVGRQAAELGRSLGIVSADDRGKVSGPAVLRTSRAVVSIWCAGVLLATVLMAALIVGRRAALVLGLLLAVEPWLIGHSGLLHTDAFVTMFGFAGFLATARCGQSIMERARGEAPPDGRVAGALARPWIWAVIAGVFWGWALLSKLNAVVLVVAALVAVPAAVLVEAWRSPAVRAGEVGGAWFRNLVVLLAAAGGTVLLMWPALWADPFGQIDALARSASQVDEGNLVFFAGEATTEPPRRFYPVVLLFRLSPWLVLSAVAGASFAMWRCAFGDRGRVGTSLLAPALVVCGAYALTIGTASKVYDRYALVFVPFVALGVAISADRAATLLAARRPGALRQARPAMLAVAAVVSLYVATLAPYEVSYVSPLAGGQRAAARWIPLGWGEGMEQADAWIRQNDGRPCGEITVSVSWFLPDAMGCARMVGWEWSRGGAETPDYAVVYILAAQRGLTDAQLTALRAQGSVAARLRVQGAVYAELWALEASEPDR